ncbi:hypothetical protein [Bacillus sp. FJAT-52991]|uniref:Uncharacterized protein n=1 Tax=Bacillus kandeliae TaxID=3129297 RepID=A0ABZ2N465_9BACI
MKINVKEIEELFLLLFQRMSDQGIEEINLDVDYYWDVASEDRVEFNNEEPELIVGSLIDDWESLKQEGDAKKSFCTDLLDHPCFHFFCKPL